MGISVLIKGIQRLGAKYSGEADTLAAETAIAEARVLFAGAFLIAFLLEQQALPPHHALLNYSLPFGYSIYSLALWLLLRRRLEAALGAFSLAHGADVLWAVLFVLSAQGNSYSLLFCLFVILAGAFRGGIRTTLLTTALLVVGVAGGASLLRYRVLNNFSAMLFNTHALRIGVGYLVVAGVAAGYLGKKQQQRQFELEITTQLLVKSQAGGQFGEMVRSVTEGLMATFGSGRCLLLLHDTTAGRTWMWHGEQHARAVSFQSERAGSLGVLEMRRGPRTSLRALRCLLQAPIGLVTVRRKKEQLFVRLLSESGRMGKAAATEWVEALASVPGFANALAVGFQRGNWTVRLVLLKAGRRGYTASQAHLLQRIAEKIFPVVHNFYVFHRVRQRTGALERVKIARELHDGVVQALFGIEMRLFALRKGVGVGVPIRGELKEIQGIVHDQLLGLREMISRSKTTEMTSDRLVGFLSEMVDKFQRDTRIAAAFQSEVDTVELSRRQCGELARVVNEALVNVRKHSGARAVLVLLSSRAQEVVVSIEDDGAGCGFRGCMSLAELDVAGLGPAMIKERVRSIGGNLRIESFPGKGTRIEVALTKEVYVVNA